VGPEPAHWGHQHNWQPVSNLRNSELAVVQTKLFNTTRHDRQITLANNKDKPREQLRRHLLLFHIKSILAHKGVIGTKQDNKFRTKKLRENAKPHSWENLFIPKDLHIL
jgi:hypothetical protein